ncbi:glycosyltransferase [Sphingomonas sp. LB-2]|uniref:glycosyltransferase n=1 Tax=Sphingomonas caeni TaxID=2984949 RepID=UPI002231047E|nr:glycosyltransferase [Sphingomonas caeni]MCW3846628.1 glycosyltransferase [Sphingomonas caeni]
MSPRVSVVMPVHDGGRHLARSIGSILAQSLGDLELIVVDDGSSDGIAEVLAGVRDPRLVVLRQEHRGIVAALNRGCAAARASLIARMDADDIARPDRLTLQAAFLDRHPGVAAVGSAVTYIDAAGRETGRHAYPCGAERVARALRRGENALAHPAVTMRKAAFDAVGGYRERFRHAEDFDLWLRMAGRFALDNLPERLLDYRRHAESSGSRNRPAQIVASRIAVAANRLGRADPLADRERLVAGDLASMPFTAEERFELKMDIGELALGRMRNGGASDAALTDLARAVLPGLDSAELPAIAAAAFAGAAEDRRDARLARRMAALGRGLIARGQRGEGLAWLWRAATLALRRGMGQKAGA